MTGSQIPRVVSRLKPLRTLVMSADLNSTNEAFTCGIRAARLNPEAVSCCLTCWMSGARLRLTVSFLTVIAPPPLPVRARTSSAWAARLAWTQASANAWLWTILPTWVRVKLWIPPAIGPSSAWSWSAIRGGSPRPARASTVWVVRPLTSM